jgi:hypothetical protein
MSADQTRLRRLASSGEPLDPAALLRAIAKQDQRTLQAQWRARRLKELRELRDACLFAHGLGLLYGCAVTVLRGEREDYDFVLRREALDGAFEIMGVQLKELPPEDLNPTITLLELLARQTSHAPTDATLLVCLNRTGYIPDDLLGAVPVPFGELWYLWAATPDGARWCIHGDALSQARTFEFACPL